MVKCGYLYQWRDMFYTMSRGRKILELTLENNKSFLENEKKRNVLLTTKNQNVNGKYLLQNNEEPIINDISEQLPEVSGEKKIFCYLQNIDKNQDDPYEFRETSNENSDHIAINSEHQSFKDSYYIPYLEQLDFTPENKLDNLPKRTSFKEQGLQNKDLSELYSAETRYGDDGNNENNQKSYGHQIASICTPPNSGIPEREAKLGSSCENTSSTKIRILDHQIIPATSAIDQCIIVDSINPVTLEPSRIHKTISPYVEDGNSNDTYIDPDYNPESEKSSCTNSTENVFENISHHEDSISCSGEDITYNNLEQNRFERRDCPINLPEHSESTFGKNLCPFCFEDVGHFSRHLLRKHSDEDAVKKISEMKNKSKEKRMAIIALRKRGNFILNTEKNELIPVRKPKDRDKKEEQYFPCTACLGYYKKTYLWRHKKICSAVLKKRDDGSKTNHLTDAQTFLAATGILGNYLSKSRLKIEVFPNMRPDKISFIAKRDPLICLYGESYLNKHKRKQINVAVSNKIREIARLKLALQEFTTIKESIEFLKPEMYDNIIAASKIICGFNSEAKTFKASSLALHMGTNLKFFCDVARKAVITKNHLLPKLDDQAKEKKLKEISELREMIQSHWCNDISSLANKVLNEAKLEKPKLVPLTEDIKCFNNYITALASEAYEKLKNKQDIANNYKILAECTLCLVLVFNRKRVGEVQFLNIDSYKKDCLNLNQEELLNCLTEFEKNMSMCFKRVVVFGKGSKPVPILFTRRVQEYIDLLLKIREDTDVVPKLNKYVFANPGSRDRWMSGTYVLRKLANKCGAKKPELLTSTRFRKQIATILQLMHFQSDEMEQIARFMGHTEKTHREFYRLTDDTYQTAKVAKVLLLLNAGKGNELKGKSLDEIEVGQDVIEFDEKDEDGNINQKSLSEQNNSFKSPCIKDVIPDPVAIPTKHQANVTSSSVSGRVRWSASEKKLVLKFFNMNIEKKIAPKKEDCLNFIRKNGNIFKDCDWVRIKTLVYNTYRMQ